MSDVPHSDPDAADRPAELSRSDLQTRAIQGASWTLIHTLVSVPIAFAVNIVIARTLAVADYGRLAFLMTAMGIIGGIISLGIGTGLVQFGSKLHAAGRHSEVQSLLSKSQGFRLLVNLPILSAAALLIADVDPALLALAVLFGVVVPAMLDGGPACLGIENKTAAGAKNALIMALIAQVAVLATVFTVHTADAVWAVRLAVDGLAVGTSLLWVSPRYRRAILRPRLPVRFPEGFWRFAIPAGVASIVGGLVVSRTEVLGLTWLGQPESAGLFALAFGLANHLFAPAQALIGPLVPAVSALREVDGDAVPRAFHRTVRATSTVVAGMVGVAMPAFALLIPVIYGAKYAAVPPVFMALGTGGSLLVLAGPVQAFVQARLDSWALLRIYLAALAVDVGLMLALIPPLGVWGAAVANVTGALASLTMMLARELRGLDIPWRALLRAAAPVGVGIGAGAVAFGVGSISGVVPIAGALLSGGVGAGLLLLGLALARTGLTTADRDAILATLPSPLQPAARWGLTLLTHASDA